jgi:diacylglycerol kinase (ATP)
MTPEPGERGGDGVFVIFNPASGRGRGAKRLDGYLALLGEHLPGFDHAVTGQAGEEGTLALQAVEDGYHTVVAVGGDGTWSHVADRLVDSGAEVRFGVLPSGTGNDFGRNLGLAFGDPAAAVRALARGPTRPVDVGRVVTPSRPAHDRSGPGSGPVPRHFLNVVGFGFDIAVIDAAARARFLKGELLYKVTALQQLFRFGGLEVEVSDGLDFRRRGSHLMLTISNGRFFGGGFPIAPGARITDGVLHACAIGDAPPLTRARLFGAAEKGRHVGSDRVELHAARSFHLSFPEPPRFEIDGDVYTAVSDRVEVEILPAALRVVGGDRERLVPPPTGGVP